MSTLKARTTQTTYKKSLWWFAQSTALIDSADASNWAGSQRAAGVCLIRTRVLLAVLFLENGPSWPNPLPCCWNLPGLHPWLPPGSLPSSRLQTHMNERKVCCWCVLFCKMDFWFDSFDGEDISFHKGSNPQATTELACWLLSLPPFTGVLQNAFHSHHPSSCSSSHLVWFHQIDFVCLLGTRRCSPFPGQIPTLLAMTFSLVLTVDTVSSQVKWLISVARHFVKMVFALRKNDQWTFK